MICVILISGLVLVTDAKRRHRGQGGGGPRRHEIQCNTTTPCPTHFNCTDLNTTTPTSVCKISITTCSNNAECFYDVTNHTCVNKTCEREKIRGDCKGKGGCQIDANAIVCYNKTGEVTVENPCVNSGTIEYECERVCRNETSEIRICKQVCQPPTTTDPATDPVDVCTAANDQTKCHDGRCNIIKKRAHHHG
jgi:hypothetical protein